MPESIAYTPNWDFSDRHIDENIKGDNATNFFSSARCIIYAQPSSDNSITDSQKFKRIGVVQSFSFQEQKSIDMIFELGSDIPYYIPGRTTGALNLSRILLSGEDLTNMIYQIDPNGARSAGYSYISTLRDPRLNRPFDLLFAYYGETNKANVGADTAYSGAQFAATYSRLFKNCYIQSRHEGLQAGGSVLVAESVSIAYQHIAKVTFMQYGVDGSLTDPTSFRTQG